MTDLTIWRMPRPALRGIRHVVVRGSRGVCYSLPEMRAAWPTLVRLGYLPDKLRWQKGSVPDHEPLSPQAAEALARWLELPGYISTDEPADVTALVHLAESAIADLEVLERAALEPPPRLAAQPADSLRTHRAHVETPEDILRLVGVTP